MKKRLGCPPGSWPTKEGCVLGSIPHTGTVLVPSIENIEGCRAVYGEWDHNRNLCLADDGISYGMTAPIKGAIVEWSVWDPNVDGPFDNELEEPLCAAVNVYLIGHHKQSEERFSTIDDEPVFHDESLMEYTPTCWIDDSGEMLELLRDDALRLAKAIKEGNAQEFGLGYYTPKGFPCSSTDREAVVSQFGYQVRDAYSELKLKPIKPFRIRGYGKPR